MDLYEVMRTTFAAREFEPDPVSDAQLAAILEHARFAPSGGNRQGWHVLVVRDPEVRARMAQLTEPAARRYAAQMRAGESPWNPLAPPGPDEQTIAETPVPDLLTAPLLRAPVVLVVCLDLRLVAAVDQDLARIAVAPGASIYPFVWNILLAARNEGLGGTLTTLPISREPDLQGLLGIPDHVAIAAVIPLGHPVRQLTRLRRKPVSAFTTVERWGGPRLESSG
ncbi:MAG: nitroreductase family protein [Dehalococcoidia bacterium]